mgnify:CR=1 FL=1
MNWCTTFLLRKNILNFCCLGPVFQFYFIPTPKTFANLFCYHFRFSHVNFNHPTYPPFSTLPKMLSIGRQARAMRGNLFRVSSSTQPFIAVLRRTPGGVMKSSKVSASTRHHSMFVPPHYFKPKTISSYFTVWPRRKASFVMYGSVSSSAPALANCPGAGHRRLSTSATAESNITDSGGGQPYASLRTTKATESSQSNPSRPPRPFGVGDMLRKFRNQQPLTMVTA